MKEDVRRFYELVKTDESMRKRMEEACRDYTGDETEEAVFQNVMEPIIREAGYSFTLEDIKKSAEELDLDEMAQVAGGGMGVGIGGGATMCDSLGAGIGVGMGTGGAHSICFILGWGHGSLICSSTGITVDEKDTSDYIKNM